jgi:ferrochelatase
LKENRVNDGKTGVILLNMGGPDRLDDVEPFLFNLFSDRDIIKLGPPFLQKFIAGIISRRRAPKSRSIYNRIGGSSPLKKITSQQAMALSDALSVHGNFIVSFAMRYWPPFAESALQEMKGENVSKLVVLPLYPHFSKATTGSSIKHLQASLTRICPDVPVNIIESWPTQPLYVQAVAENIIRGLKDFNGARTAVVYSAHSLPVSFIAEGDPYVEHIRQSIEAIEGITGIPGHLCYQSRSGPVEWLSPSTEEMIDKLAADGCRHILMVPLSFVSDHVETLYEIGMHYRELAGNKGIELRPCASLNTQTLFIRGLRDLVLGAQGPVQGIS